MFFRRLFTIWFFLFTLASSAAWAMDDHSEIDHGNTALETGSDPDEPLPWSEDCCSDHCCHASAHALGLISTANASAVLPLSDHVVFSESTPHSLTLSPPFHPPIA
jgi:hypothetical protein